VWQQQIGQNVSRFASSHTAAILSDNIINKNIKSIANKLFASKSECFVNVPSRSHCTCNRTYGKSMQVYNYKYTDDYTHQCKFSNML